jgi:hypothetical protein
MFILRPYGLKMTCSALRANLVVHGFRSFPLEVTAAATVIAMA